MRTHEGNGQPRRRQGIVAGHGTKVRGWDRICREAGTRGAWGDRPRGHVKRQPENALHGVFRHNRRAQNAVFGRRVRGFRSSKEAAVRARIVQ